MPGKEAAVADRASAVIPAILCEHGDDVAEVHAESGYRLRVRFYDGISGWVDMSKLINSDHAGVFAALRDPAKFAEAGIELGAVTWPGGLDLAPDAMYEALKDCGEWILN